MTDLKGHKVADLPKSAYYIPNFIRFEEENFLLEKIYSAPKPKWKVLLNRRLQNWGGLPHPKGMIAEEIPKWLAACMEKVQDLGIYGDKAPNHVLVNEYLPGQGIMPHEDGPLFYPTIATLNLGSHTVLDYYKKASTEDEEDKELTDLESRYVGSLLLERRSLLIVQDDLYHKYLHGIKEQTCDMVLKNNIKNLSLCDNKSDELKRETRISLTIRHVPKTVKANLFLKIK